MPLFHTEFRALGGPGEIQLEASDEVAARRAFKAALDEIDRIELKYSRYRPDSLISRINAAAGGEPVSCDEETRALLDYAHTLHERSGGRFDLSSGVWRRAWDFRDPRARPPTADQLQALAPLVGWAQVQRSAAGVRLAQVGMQLDLGGIGKEYAVDRAAAALAAQGVGRGLVNLAGDLRTLGDRPDGQPWRVGVRRPDAPTVLLAEIELRGSALATSGDYERSLVHDGRRWGHVLDARTGWPVSHWRSVSVRADSTLVAGSLATLAMLMEAEGLKLLQDSGADFLAVDAQGQVHDRSGNRPLPPVPGQGVPATI